MDSQSSIAQIELESMLHYDDAEHKTLPYSLLVEITKDFSEELKIGSGGFADVYKAQLVNGVVAVKRLRNTSIDENEFYRELECLIKVKHKNIVRFLGHCGETQLNAFKNENRKIVAEERRRLLCFEYLPNGTLYDYIKGSFGEIEWPKCYQMIEGICQGLSYLHQENILHLDLKPGNILLDKDFMPKITDFGLSRCFDEGGSHISASKVGGTVGYWAPESFDDDIRTESGTYKITDKFDIYSLGVMIMELLTGKRGCRTIEDVHRSWSHKPDMTWWNQIQVCAEIAIECTDVNPTNRPKSMKDIIKRLFEIESSMQVTTSSGTSNLLVLHSSLLRFVFEPNKIITCPLQLTNSSDKHIGFRLMEKSGVPSFLSLPLYGVVPPSSHYTLIVTTKEKKELPRKWIIDVISATLILEDDEHINSFQSQPDKYLQKMWNAVQEEELKALYTLPQHITTSSPESIAPMVKIILTMEETIRYPIDTNQAKQWIIKGEHNGQVGIWDYQTQRKVDSLGVSESYNVKFVARKQWIVIGTLDGHVQVYDYEEKRMVKSFNLTPQNRSSSFLGPIRLTSVLAVHPTRPYLLLEDNGMQLLDWDKDWECVQTFKCSGTSFVVVFNPEDTFARSLDCTVEIWNLDSPEPDYVLSGHSGKVSCLDFFTCHDQEFLVTGSHDRTAKIWYLPKKLCSYTLEGFVSPVTSVLHQHNLQTLIIGSEDGAIYLWSTTNCRSSSPTLKKVIKIGCLGRICHLRSAMERVVIGGPMAVAIMDINNVNYQEQPRVCGGQQLSADMRQQPGDTTSKGTKEITGSIKKPLDVHPLELRFPYHPNEPITCTLHLTNNIDENMAFRLIDKSGKSPWCLAKMPLYGIVPRKSVCTLVVTTKEEMKLKKETDFDLVIQSTLSGEKYTVLFQDQSGCDRFFEEAKYFGNIVNELTLKAIYVPDEEITSQDILVKYNRDTLCSMEAHPTEQWILTGHRSGYAHIWNHEIKCPMNSFKVSDHSVHTIKFITRKKWIVAVTDNGDLHVYVCACVTKIEKIFCIESSNKARKPILAVHPILPYVLSPDTMLLDWEEGWECRELFFCFLVNVAFNPVDTNSFVGGWNDGRVQVWRLDSSLSAFSYADKPEHSFRAHRKKVTSLDFITHGDQQYLVTGSEDCTAKIWDLQKWENICTLEAMSPIRSVLVHPDFPVLITGTEHGIIHLWSSTDFRLKRTFNFGGGGAVVSLACLMGSPRIVIGQENAISVMEVPEVSMMPKELTPQPKLRNDSLYHRDYKVVTPQPKLRKESKRFLKRFLHTANML